MKVLIINGSRADWNGLGMVARALLGNGHSVFVAALTRGQLNEARQTAIAEDVGAGRLTPCDFEAPGMWASDATPGFVFGQLAAGAVSCVAAAVMGYAPDLVLLGGDRWETLASALACSIARVPVVHLAGGDQTEGSADDRFRDAITALACVHCATNVNAYMRLSRRLIRLDDLIALTGSPAIDRIKATAPTKLVHRVLDGRGSGALNVLVQVHPNTVGDDATLDAVHTASAVVALRATSTGRPVNVIALGAADDPGKEQVDKLLRATSDTFLENLRPAEYYWLLGAVDVLVGNSSAALYEAPSFSLPAVLVGNRQKGRILPSNVIEVPADATQIVEAIKTAFTLEGPFDNPYDRGDASAHVVQAMEAFWLSRSSSVSRETLPVNLAATERRVPRYEDQGSEQQNA